MHRRRKGALTSSFVMSSHNQVGTSSASAAGVQGVPTDSIASYGDAKRHHPTLVEFDVGLKPRYFMPVDNNPPSTGRNVGRARKTSHCRLQLGTRRDM